MGQFLISEYANALWNDVMDLASDVSLYSEVLVPTDILFIAESYEAILKTVAVWRTITSTKQFKNSAEQSKTLEDRIQVVQIVIPSAYI